MIPSKICSACQTEKTIEDWGRNAARKDGLSVYCKECNSIKQRAYYEKAKTVRLAKSKKWAEANRERAREQSRRSHLKRTYGITLEQYNELLEAQGGCCAICGKSAEAEGRALAVDHDHQTGEIFGLLCWFCNHKFISKVRDPEKYLNAAEYLKKGTGWFVPPKKKKKKRTKK